MEDFTSPDPSKERPDANDHKTYLAFFYLFIHSFLGPFIRSLVR